MSKIARTTIQSHLTHLELFPPRKQVTTSPNKRRTFSLQPISKNHLSPYINNMNKILNKIGSNPTRTFYEPSEEQQQSFRDTRYLELKSELVRNKKKKQPFNF